MYLLALVTKWRNKGVRFTIDYPMTDRIEIVAEIRAHGKYFSMITDDIEYGCRCIDAGLTKFMEERPGNDNNYPNS